MVWQTSHSLTKIEQILTLNLLWHRSSKSDQLHSKQARKARKSPGTLGLKKVWGEKVWAQNIFIDFLAELDNFKKINFPFFQFQFQLTVDTYFIDWRSERKKVTHSLTDWLTDNLKAKDASESKKLAKAGMGHSHRSRWEYEPVEYDRKDFEF